ncbi:hypothetical protein DSECCO2_622130 [anaerobic digester metagenome]
MPDGVAGRVVDGRGEIARGHLVGQERHAPHRREQDPPAHADEDDRQNQGQDHAHQGVFDQPPLDPGHEVVGGDPGGEGQVPGLEVVQGHLKTPAAGLQARPPRPVAGRNDGRGLFRRPGHVDDRPPPSVEGQGAAVPADAHAAHEIREGLADQRVRDLKRPQHLRSGQVRERHVGGHAPRPSQPYEAFPGLSGPDRLQGRVPPAQEGALAPQGHGCLQRRGDVDQHAFVQLEEGGRPARQLRHLARHCIVLVQVDRAVLEGRKNRRAHVPSVLVDQLQFGLHEHLGHREAAQFELCLHDVAVDAQLLLHEGMLQGHRLGQGGRDAGQPVAPLAQGVGVGHEDLGNGETQNRHKDDGDGHDREFCLKSQRVVHT